MMPNKAVVSCRVLQKEDFQTYLPDYNRLIGQLPKRPTISAQTMGQLIAAGNYICMAEESGIQGAVATGTLTFTLKREGLWGYAEDIVVDDHWRMHGFGEALTKWMLEFARDSIGASGVQITSHSFRDVAHRMFSAMGFEVVPTSVFRRTFNDQGKG